MKRTIAIGFAVLSLLAPLRAEAKKGFVDWAAKTYEQNNSYVLPATGQIEVAFSPNEGAENLVLKTIDSAKNEIKVLAYSFTSASIVDALIRAKKRGVNVALVADHRSNVNDHEEGKAKSRAALSALVNAGCDVRTISAYPIHHDKIIIVDRQTVELGSYNYSAAAANRNSENVLVNWNNPKLAEIYLGHFERNQKQSAPFNTQY